MKNKRQIALVILEYPDGRIALQLRNNFPHIGHPDHWGFFGGGAEKGENVVDAALREIEEELAIHLNPKKLTLVKSFDYEQDKVLVLFRYPVTDGLKNARLGEGQRFAAHTKESIELGYIDEKRVVPVHLEMLNWYWQSTDLANTKS